MEFLKKPACIKEIIKPLTTKFESEGIRLKKAAEYTSIKRNTASKILKTILKAQEKIPKESSRRK